MVGGGLGVVERVTRHKVMGYGDVGSRIAMVRFYLTSMANSIKSETALLLFVI